MCSVAGAVNGNMPPSGLRTPEPDSNSGSIHILASLPTPAAFFLIKLRITLFGVQASDWCSKTICVAPQPGPNGPAFLFLMGNHFRRGEVVVLKSLRQVSDKGRRQTRAPEVNCPPWFAS